jgi:hypothetical protein
VLFTAGICKTPVFTADKSLLTAGGEPRSNHTASVITGQQVIGGPGRLFRVDKHNSWLL